MVDHEVHYQPQPAAVHLDQQFLPVGERAELVHDALVVADVVAVVVVGRLVDRRQRDDVDAEFLQIVEPADDPFQVTDPIAVAVAEAARINLVDDAPLPPARGHGAISGHGRGGSPEPKRLMDGRFRRYCLSRYNRPSLLAVHASSSGHGMIVDFTLCMTMASATARLIPSTSKE